MRNWMWTLKKIGTQTLGFQKGKGGETVKTFHPDPKGEHSFSWLAPSEKKKRKGRNNPPRFQIQGVWRGGSKSGGRGRNDLARHGREKSRKAGIGPRVL